jgi:CheY-like chemotaxis protein
MRDPPQQRAVPRPSFARNRDRALPDQRKARELDALPVSAADAPRRLPQPAARAGRSSGNTWTPELAAAPAACASPRRGFQPVLIVLEDVREDFTRLKRALWKSGATARVWWARHAAEGLEILGQFECRSWAPCILACLQTPGVDFALVNTVKARDWVACPRFAFITHPDGRFMERRAYAAGADAFFVKPTEPETWREIARALQRLLSAAPGATVHPSVPPPRQRSGP